MENYLLPLELNKGIKCRFYNAQSQLGNGFAKQGTDIFTYKRIKQTYFMGEGFSRNRYYHTVSFNDKFGHLGEKELNWKPNARTWSIAQNIDHLMVVNENLFSCFGFFERRRL